MARLHPITFSIPECKIIDTIQLKTKFVSNLIPGNMSTYIYKTEEEYYDEYKKSCFAITKLKGGWDCLRHYEILACGTIPYFENLQNCPPNTLFLFPKFLVLEGNALFNKIMHNQNFNDEDKSKYYEILHKLLDYTKNNLTTTALAKYVLNVSNFSNVSKILYLSGDVGPDYLRCLTLHGFKTTFGKNCHDYPKIQHIYKDHNINVSNNGKGYTYTNLLSNDLHDNDFDLSVEQDIINQHYDIIIYGSYHRGMPYYDLVQSYYPSDKILLLCGEDLHNCNYSKYIEKGHHVFVREL